MSKKAKNQAKISITSNNTPLKVDTDDTFEAVLKTYEYTQHWIVLADTKAGLILTVQGVLVGFILQQMTKWKEALLSQSTSHLSFYFIIFFLTLYFIFKITSFLYVIKVFFPRVLKNVDYSKTRHIFNVGMTAAFPKAEDNEKLWQEYKKLSEEDLKKEYVYQLHTDSNVCSMKYKNLTMSMKTLLYAFVFAFIVFVSSVIVL